MHRVSGFPCASLCVLRCLVSVLHVTNGVGICVPRLVFHNRVSAERDEKGVRTDKRSCFVQGAAEVDHPFASGLRGEGPPAHHTT